MTKKTLALAASMIALVTMSGQAFAGTATARSDSKVPRTFNASHAAMVAPPAVEPNAHRYHGGPKVND